MSVHSEASAMPFLSEALIYVKRIKQFSPSDWFKYSAWIGSIGFLFVGITTFLVFGYVSGVQFPAYVWNIPIATFVFGASLSLDDIGHRTVYKEDLLSGEVYVHQMIGLTAVGSVMALCLCYQHGELMQIPAVSLIFLSFFYSAIDEWLHWQRYMKKGVDRVEMWCHFFAIGGHAIMIYAWWHWYSQGYLGVAETLTALDSLWN